MKLKRLLKEILIEQQIGKTNIAIAGLAFDSREVQKDWLFIAIRGAIADGHKYIEAAIEKGATAIICEELPQNPKADITWILVKDTRHTLAKIAHTFYDDPTGKMKVVGITGTNGKTTISFLLKSIFEYAGFKTGVIGTTGIFYDGKFIDVANTTPDALTLAKTLSEMHDAGVKYVFIEVSSHALVQHRAEGIQFDAGIFTNLTHEHLDYHETIEKYAQAKKILFDYLPKNGFAILNADDEYAEYMVGDTKARCLLVGHEIYPHYIITEDHIDAVSSHYMLNKHKIETTLTGKFNIDNSAAVFATADSFGLKTKTIIKALKIAIGAPGRMERVVLKSGAAAFVDYAHTPDALEKALITCFQIKPQNAKLIAVVGCGGDRDTTKRPIMGRLVSRIADIAIITSDNPRTEDPNAIINEIVGGMPLDAKENVIIEADRRVAIAKACELSSEGDIILVAGKGHETYQIIGTEKTHLSDLEELAKSK